MAGRVRVTPEIGSPITDPFFATVEMADNAIDGTELNAANFLAPETAEALGVASEDPTVNEAFLSLIDTLASKPDGGRRIRYTPELKTSDSNQDFIYSRQNGAYALLGDKCFFDFDIIITNMPQSQATGNISVAAPLPYVDMANANPIAYNMVPSSSNIVGISFLSAGNFQAIFNNAPYATFNMAHINKISTTSFRLFGQINYYWR